MFTHFASLLIAFHAIFGFSLASLSRLYPPWPPLPCPRSPPWCPRPLGLPVGDLGPVEVAALQVRSLLVEVHAGGSTSKAR